mmetsp:Transcript_27958/g.64757  ORF Transcript_27958/g.64757 Transcript_27958/m.64757 type:complete len:113 (+) Transcript_27958:409-747(+)
MKVSHISLTGHKIHLACTQSLWYNHLDDHNGVGSQNHLDKRLRFHSPQDKTLGLDPYPYPLTWVPYFAMGWLTKGESSGLDSPSLNLWGQVSPMHWARWMEKEKGSRKENVL